MKKFLFRFLFFIAVHSLLIKIIAAQTQPYRFDYIPGSRDVMGPLNSAVIQDKDGYMWMSAYSGLLKFDGYSFTPYRYEPFNINSPGQNILYNMMIDSGDSIWLGTPEGFTIFNRKSAQFTRYNGKPGDTIPELRNVSAFAKDTDGHFWIGNYEGSLWNFDPEKAVFIPVDLDSAYIIHIKEREDFHNSIYQIFKDSRQRIWVCSNTGLHLLHKRQDRLNGNTDYTFTHYRHSDTSLFSLADPNVFNMEEDHAGTLWVVTEKALHTMDPETGFIRRFFTATDQRWSAGSEGFFGTGKIIVEDHDKNIWFVASNTVYCINRERTEIRKITDNINGSGMSTILISAIGMESGGNMFFISGAGIHILTLNRKKFGLIQFPESKNDPKIMEITSVFEDASGITWVGTFGGGLKRWNRATGEIKHYLPEAGNAQSLKANTVFGIISDAAGKLWVANGEYISCMVKDGVFIHFNTNKKNYEDYDAKNIYSLSPDKNGLIWLGTGNGIKSFDPRTGEMEHFYYERENPDGISDYTAQAVYADSYGNVWVGTGSIAFNRFDTKTRKFVRFTTNPSDSTTISSNIINCITQDSKGIVWIGTMGGGICRFDYSTNRFSTYMEKQGLKASNVFSIQEDKNGFLWLGTENGLVKFNPSTGAFIHFNEKDGLQSNFFGGGFRTKGSVFMGKNGLIYAGGARGLNYFYPDSVHLNAYIPPVVITTFKLFDKVRPGANEEKEIVLKHNENLFSFEFSALNYTNTEKNEYAYRLVGFDPDWIYSGTRRYAGYTNLDPGEYVFQVKGSNNDGIWNEKGTQVKVIILPPWWRTGWAYAFYVLIFIAGIILIDRYQRTQLIRKEREKAREKELEQAQEIQRAYHRLQQTQTQLIHSEKMASLGELTAGIAHEIQNPLNFVNNFSEVNKELVDELQQDLHAGNIPDALVISDSIKDNEEKINFHGKRADAIVKSMLQHSRRSSGQKEPTDINALCDEYLRLAYHGFRAKDKNFNATLVTEFDESIGNINIVPQEIGRVLLNLYNNAFYALSSEALTRADKPVYSSNHEIPKNDSTHSGSFYQPTLTVKTSNLGHQVQITVTDNGPGIPQHIREKIFQPFFTTKPTGQGTGLGLSISYDIIKAHGGELKIESSNKELTEFIIHLPGV